MKRPFDLCVIFAEMRTGSNHLEAMLDGVLGLRGFGEVYNPAFVGRPNQEALFGFDLARRESAPEELLAAIRAGAAADLPIFRFFHDHDPRMLGPLLDDPRVAKVVLRRNPLDSYLSRKIAAATGQWKMTDARAQKTADIRFEAPEFETMLADWQGFAGRLARGLQLRGQTAFEIDYEDLGDVEVLTGLLRYLGSAETIDPKASKLKPQNPGGPRGKVINPGEMAEALARLDPFGMDRSVRMDLAQGAAIKTIAVAGDLMVLPVPGVLSDQWRDWFPDDPRDGLSQRELRQWMRQHPAHRKIACIQHPLARAHAVFCRQVLPRRPATTDLRRRLRRRYEIPLPQDWPDPGYDRAAHRAAFEAFLRFLKPCLAGQTSLVVPGDWSGQLAALQGMARFALPDRLLRAETLAHDLAPFGLNPEPPDADAPFALGDIHDRALEALAQDVFRRDYVFFGYGDWTGYAA